MAGIFDALPGIEVPVDSISRGLARMWEGNASQGRPSPDSEHAKATQVNFVLHLGLRTGAADAVRQFGAAVRFSHRYPCRVVVLCPLGEDSRAVDIRAKVHGECTIGKTKDDTRCCEFVMLSYPRSARTYLESQVSTCLSTDLPLYYWAHRFSESAKLADYRYLLTTAKRVLFDSASAPADAIGYPWPRPENVRDLAFARLLPIRQAIAQYLSKYSPESIARGLSGIRLVHGRSVGAEARALFKWVGERVAACGASGGHYAIEESGRLSPSSFSLAFGYPDRRFFRWSEDTAAGSSRFSASFGSGPATLSAAVGLLPIENALSEAMFF
jgi:hypothetical protein